MTILGGIKNRGKLLSLLVYINLRIDLTNASTAQSHTTEPINLSIIR